MFSTLDSLSLVVSLASPRQCNTEFCDTVRDVQPEHDDCEAGLCDAVAESLNLGAFEQEFAFPCRFVLIVEACMRVRCDVRTVQPCLSVDYSHERVGDVGFSLSD